MMKYVRRLKHWILYPDQKDLADLLVKELNLHPFIAQILINRGYSTPEAAQSFLKPTLDKLANPFLMKDMDKAVMRVEKALSSHEKITIYGDYDVDGTTGSALLYLFLKSLGAEVDVYIPHRVQEGYGLNFKALEELKERGRHLIITVDNGIGSVDQARRAQELGLDLIIIDHHQVPPTLPFAVAVLNPKQEGCLYPYKELSGVGVAFQFAMAFRSHLRKLGYFENRLEPNLKQYLDLVALGTIADLVPLTGQNRILVKAGLEVLEWSQNPGIVALKEIAGVRGRVAPGQVGFRLGPRINAAGRLNSARVGFEMLTTTDAAYARKQAIALDDANRERQALEEAIVLEACKRVEEELLPNQKKSIFLFDTNWHVGVVGIVASRLVERYYLPAIIGMLEGESIRCSARSIAGLDLYQVLKESADYLKTFGGHRYAAGLTLLNSNHQQFAQVFDQKVKDRLSEEQFTPIQKVDVIVTDGIDSKLVDQLEVLEPFGQGNAEPVFWGKNLKVSNQRRVGENHLKANIQLGAQLFDLIAFGMADQEDRMSYIQECLFSCEYNEWQGRKSIQLRLLDLPS